MIIDCVNKICEKNQIKGNITTINTKFNCNRLFCNEDVVIKLYYNNKEKYFKNEYYIYNQLSNCEFLPNVFDYGEILNCKYIVMKKLHAKPIFEIWDKISEEKKENIIMQISNILRKINSLSGDDNIISFKKFICEQFYNNYNEVNIEKDVKFNVLNFFKKTIKTLNENERALLVYSDFHFNNFLVDKNMKVYIIDFEQLIKSPLDYQLASIIHMCDDPSFEASTDLKVDKKDYQTILNYFQKYYIEMFGDNWNDRVKMYNLIYDLGAIKNKRASSNVIMKYIEK